MKQTIVFTLIVVAVTATSAVAGDFNSTISERRAGLESAIATLAPVAVGAGLVAWGQSSEPSGSEDLQAMGISVGVLGLWFGPSFGHFYARQPGRGMAGIGIRTVGFAAVLVGALASQNREPNFAPVFPGGAGSPGTVIDEGGSSSSFGTTLMLIGGSFVVGSAVYDVATASSSARKTNEAVRFGTTVDVAPVYLAQQRAVGIGISVRF